MSQMEINKVLTQMRALSGSMGLPEPNLDRARAAAGGTNFGQVLAAVDQQGQRAAGRGHRT